MVTRLPLLMGLRGLRVDNDLRDFLNNKGIPAGFLLFARNIESVDQVRKLTGELADICGFRPLIAVDQEGGRVQRLRFEGRLPPAGVLGEWYDEDRDSALDAAFLEGFLLASELRGVGANWVLGPVLDLALAQTHEIIGDRAFAAQPEKIVALAKMWLKGVHEAGCLGCMKHAPGHGRAVVDSHAELPVVESKSEELLLDMAPFAAVASGVESLMTAHIKYLALDDVVATFSRKILMMMRKSWEFEGLILADDLGMKALSGDYVSRIERALAAGCDIAITAFSSLQQGMAGTKFDEEDWRLVYGADLPVSAGESLVRLTKLEKMTVTYDDLGKDKVEEMRARFLRLWADCPFGMR